MLKVINLYIKSIAQQMNTFKLIMCVMKVFGSNNHSLNNYSMVCIKI
jgi:hypothetical protein